MVTESKFNDKDDKSENIVSVYNLPSIYDESDVQSLFANVGTVVQCSIEHDTSKLSSRAIVKFSSEKEAEDAAVLSGVSVRYHILKIIKGRPPVIAKNGDHKDSISEGTRNKIAQSIESIGETNTRTTSRLPEEEASSNGRSSPPESEKRNESKRTSTTKRDDNRGSDYRARDRFKRTTKRIRSTSSSNSDSSRDSSRRITHPVEVIRDIDQGGIQDTAGAGKSIEDVTQEVQVGHRVTVREVMTTQEIVPEAAVAEATTVMRVIGTILGAEKGTVEGEADPEVENDMEGDIDTEDKF
ncbi:hypothetical protein MACK_001641 [Theileria orientalis]|uniref:RRM domain-containing protein n=1 Tax=Theileria orientalis TaxID=68886 RepID=A0A976MEV3_THEOR|nr:hypothetical protein MACK_001641 [Theileria orientalis]